MDAHHNLRSLPNIREIERWLMEYLAKALGLPSDAIDATTPFDDYGLDSAMAIGMTGDLGDWLGCELDPMIAYDYPTIAALAAYLAEQRIKNDHP